MSPARPTTPVRGDILQYVSRYSSAEDGGDIWGDAPVYTTWSAVAVPEPTSGLLLLLGVAGLALRRRRA